MYDAYMFESDCVDFYATIALNRLWGSYFGARVYLCIRIYKYNREAR
jgi:hypothetical protein